MLRFGSQAKNTEFIVSSLTEKRNQHKLIKNVKLTLCSCIHFINIILKKNHFSLLLLILCCYTKYNLKPKPVYIIYYK